MVEHAQLIDTSLLHEPKGIKESEAGEVYVSTVQNITTGPYTGEWRKLKVEDLDLQKQQTSTPTYTPQPQPTSINSTIVAQTTGVLVNASTFNQVNSNTQDLYLALVNARNRILTLEDTVNKLKTLVTSLNNGLKTLDLFIEE